MKLPESSGSLPRMDPYTPRESLHDKRFPVQPSALSGWSVAGHLLALGVVLATTFVALGIIGFVHSPSIFDEDGVMTPESPFTAATARLLVAVLIGTVLMGFPAVRDRTPQPVRWASRALVAVAAAVNVLWAFSLGGVVAPGLVGLTNGPSDGLLLAAFCYLLAVAPTFCASWMVARPRRAFA